MAKTVEERVQEIMENMKHIGEIRIMKNGERVKCIDVSDMGNKGVFQFLDRPDNLNVVRRFDVFEDGGVRFPSRKIIERDNRDMNRHHEGIGRKLYCPDGKGQAATIVDVTKEGNAVLELENGEQFISPYNSQYMHPVFGRDPQTKKITHILYSTYSFICIEIATATRIAKERMIGLNNMPKKVDAISDVTSLMPGTLLRITPLGGKIIKNTVVFGPCIGFPDGTTMFLTDLQDKINAGYMQVEKQDCVA